MSDVREEWCVWRYDKGDDFWETQCDNAHVFGDGGPDDNQYRFCPYCGKKLAEIVPPTDDEEDA